MALRTVNGPPQPTLTNTIEILVESVLDCYWGEDFLWESKNEHLVNKLQ